MPKVSAEHRAQRREQITSAALRCVARDGFHRTTMADIVGESGLSAGAVYGYFASKTEIIHALVESSMGRVAAEVEAEVSAHDLGVADTVEQLVRGLTSMATTGETDLTVIAVQAWGEAIRDPEARAIILPRLLQIRGFLAKGARHDIAAGHLPSHSDPDLVAKVCLSLMPGFILQRALLGDVDGEEYAATVHQVLRGGTR